MIKWREPNPIKWPAVVDMVKLISQRSIDELVKHRMTQKPPVDLAYNGWLIVPKDYAMNARGRVVASKLYRPYRR